MASDTEQLLPTKEETSCELARSEPQYSKSRTATKQWKWQFNLAVHLSLITIYTFLSIVFIRISTRTSLKANGMDILLRINLSTLFPRLTNLSNLKSCHPPQQNALPKPHF